MRAWPQSHFVEPWRANGNKLHHKTMMTKRQRAECTARWAPFTRVPFCPAAAGQGSYSWTLILHTEGQRPREAAWPTLGVTQAADAGVLALTQGPRQPLLPGDLRQSLLSLLSVK